MAMILAVVAFLLYLRTLAPSIVFLFDDTLEIQYVVPRLGILHQTGYPLYALLGKLFTLLIPLNDPAFRLNLFSAVTGAIAIAFVYLVAQKLTAHRVAAIIAAVTFAVGDTFWAQSVAAEVYALQMLLTGIVLYMTLRYGSLLTNRALYALAFAMGLALTHHRLTLLLYPAIAIYVLLVNRNFWRDYKTLARAALFFIIPLSLYIYLPLRGAVGSADGTYENTVTGFIDWIMASKYTAFLRGNPLNVQHDAVYFWTMFQNQFTFVGLVLAAIGLVWLARKKSEWTLLVVALIVEAGFAFNYRTDDVPVHFLTTFLLLAIFVGAGIDALISLLSDIKIQIPSLRLLPPALAILLSLLLFIVPLNLLATNYAANDLSQNWDVHDYGLDMASQPVEQNATVVGILGEMTLIRYFQETRGLAPKLQTIAADTEEARLTAIAAALIQNRAVYITRPLQGAPEKYSLTAFGPLIRVLPKPAAVPPAISHPFNPPAELGTVNLLGYDLDTSRLNAKPGLWHAENGKRLRVTLYWQVIDRIETDAMVSIKLLRADKHVLGQVDHRPVLDAYPTTSWRPGEIIADTFDVPVFLGVTPSAYALSVTMYDSKSGGVIGQKSMENIPLEPYAIAPRFAAWNITHATDSDFGLLTLAGYSLDSSAPIRPGDTLPLMLLWRAGMQKLPDNLRAQIWLEDARGQHVTSRELLISTGYPPFEWQPSTFVRDWPQMRVPANISDDKYSVKLAVSRSQKLLGSTLTPFNATVVDLGFVTIKNRERVMAAPSISHAAEATLDKKVKLLGYDLQFDQPHVVQIKLFWRALAPIDTSYSVFVHLLDAKNQVVASGDAVPGNGEFPTTGWIADEYITDAHTLDIADLPRGPYQIEIGLYDPTTGVRLKTADGQDRVLFNQVTLP
jgi:hypothetical protein